MKFKNKGKILDYQNTKTIYRLIVTTVALFGFVIHMIYNFQLQWSNSIISKIYTTDEEPIRVPSVSLCSDPPWSFEKLVAEGLDINCDVSFNCGYGLMDTMKGFLKPGQNFSLEKIKIEPKDILARATWDGNEIALDSIEWKESIVGAMYCFTWEVDFEVRYPIDDHLKLQLKQIPKVHDCPRVNRYTCSEAMENCNVTCADRFLNILSANKMRNNYVFLHGRHELPIPGSVQPMILMNEKDNFRLNLEYSEQNIKNIPQNECLHARDQSKCVQDCVLNLILNKTECIVYDGILSCETMKSWFTLWSLQQEVLTFEFEWWRECTCIQACQMEHYSIASKTKNYTSDVTEITISFKTLQHLKVDEQFAYTLSNFLSDTGGAAGLWLGVSGLSISIAIIEQLADIWRYVICSHL